MASLKKAEIKKKTAEEIEAEIQEARRIAEELEAVAEASRLAAEAEEKKKRLSRKEDRNQIWRNEADNENRMNVDSEKLPQKPTEMAKENGPLTEKETRALRKKLLNERWEKAVGKNTDASF